MCLGWSKIDDFWVPNHEIDMSNPQDLKIRRVSKSIRPHLEMSRGGSEGSDPPGSMDPKGISYPQTMI